MKQTICDRCGIVVTDDREWLLNLWEGVSFSSKTHQLELCKPCGKDVLKYTTNGREDGE